MSHDDHIPRCKHDRRFFDDCPECENEAEIALSEDTAKYIAKLKARIVELEKAIEVLANEVYFSRTMLYMASNASDAECEWSRRVILATDGNKTASAALDQCDTHHDLGDEAP